MIELVRAALIIINMYVSCSSYFIGRQYENKNGIWKEFKIVT